MLKSLHVKNFTVFEDAKFDFGPGLNVIVGANGTGKSHVLKVGYAVESLAASSKRVDKEGIGRSTSFDWMLSLRSSLSELFLTKPAYHLNSLVRYSQKQSARGHATVCAYFETDKNEFGQPLDFGIFPNEDRAAAVGLSSSPTAIKNTQAAPVLLPAKEVLSFYRGFGSILRKFELQFDRTYLDLWDALALPPLRTQPPIIKEVLEPAMQGRIVLEGEEFVFYPLHGEKLEINMVAEGVRKLGMLSVLLANGSLTPDTTLFWDEPEANLNPQLIKKLAEILVLLARQKFQIVLATHSLFLMRELHVLAQQASTPIQYFSLSGGQLGEPTTVETATELPLLPNIAALAAELELAEDYLDTLNKPHAGIL